MTGVQLETALGSVMASLIQMDPNEIEEAEKKLASLSMSTSVVLEIGQTRLVYQLRQLRGAAIQATSLWRSTQPMANGASAYSFEGTQQSSNQSGDISVTG